MYPASSGSVIFINHLIAILFVQSIIVFVEVLVNFKRGGSLKKLILLFALNTAFVSFGFLYCNYYGYNRWLLDLPSNTMGATILLFLSFLYKYEIKQYIVAFIVLIFLMQLLVFLYFTFIYPVDPSINLLTVDKGRDLIRYIKFGFIAGLIIIIADLFLKIRKKYSFANIYHDEYKKWVTILAASMIIMLITNAFRNYYNLSSFVGGLIIIFELFTILLIILFRPKFLNSANLKVSLSDVFNKTDNLEFPVAHFSDIFFDKQFYLDSEASLESMAKVLKINPEDLYRFIYKNYNSSFTDLINRNRVRYFIDLVRSGKYTNYTIDALAQKSGFTSRHHMFKPFRKFHGGNPSDFIRSVSQ